MAGHNNLRDRFADLIGKAFNPSHVRNNPLIFVYFSVKRPKAKPARSKVTTVPAATPLLEDTEYKGDILICDLWHNGTDNVYDMSVVNTDAKSHSTKIPENFLQDVEREKKKMYQEACLQQRRHSSPFIASVNGILGVEARATLERIASCLAKKWRKPYSRTYGYVKSRVNITLVRRAHRCIRGSRVLAHKISVHRP